MQVLEHAFTVLDLAPAQAPRVGAVQPGGMALEPHPFEGLAAMLPPAGPGQRETDDHEDDDTGTP